MAIRILKEEPIEATFVKRLNRFTVRCKKGLDHIDAYLPNPGRLIELLLEGVDIYLVKSDNGTLRYRAIAVLKDQQPVLLDTHLNNSVFRRLVEEGLLKDFEDVRGLKSEVRVGNSRFDFVFYRNDETHLVEVKSCTLFGRQIALFPDAPTERGSRHLRELDDLQKRGFKSHVFFIVHSLCPDWFMPDYHTDLAFAQTFLEVYDRIDIKAVGLRWNHQLEIEPPVKRLSIPVEFITKEAKDRGSYLLIIRLNRAKDIAVGSLGEVGLRAGFYVYVGSAMANLSKRIKRHSRKNKNKFWHIDYLLEEADFLKALPVRGSERLECAIAEEISRLSDWSVSAFGSSDCSCSSHLFGFETDPLSNKKFAERLLWFRADRNARYLY